MGSSPILLEVFVMGKKNVNTFSSLISKLNPFFYISLLLHVLFYYFNKYIGTNNTQHKELSQKKEINSKVTLLYIKQFSTDTFYELLDHILVNRNIISLNQKNATKIENVRVKQTSWQFFNNEKKFNSLLSMNALIGLKYLWLFVRYWAIGLLLFLLAAYYLLYIRSLAINKILFEWVLIIMFLYWLLSGFVFFIKKYQYSKFTSVIQRFWKRSYILFWLIETGVFLTFFYLTLNASEEPVYMYDQMKLYKTQLFSWRFFIIKIIPIVLLILLGYFVQLSLKWNLFNKQSSFLLLITLLLIYVVWLEFYQFFHIINFYGNLVWVYDIDEYLWNLEIEFRRTRLLNNYIAVCLMAKFWHLIFIFVFWVFFILRVSEINRVRYPLLVANLQNFIILYIMSWLYMVPWLKFALRRHLSSSYFWFFQNFRSIGVRVFFYDLKLFFFSIINYFQHFVKFNTSYFSYNFFYWTFRCENSNYFKNHFIKDYIITQLN